MVKQGRRVVTGRNLSRGYRIANCAEKPSVLVSDCLFSSGDLSLDAWRTLICWPIWGVMRGGGGRTATSQQPVACCMQLPCGSSSRCLCRMCTQGNATQGRAIVLKSTQRQDARMSHVVRSSVSQRHSAVTTSGTKRASPLPMHCVQRPAHAVSLIRISASRRPRVNAEASWACSSAMAHFAQP